MTYGRPPDSVPIDQYPTVPYTAVGQYIHTHIPKTSSLLKDPQVSVLFPG